MKPTLRLVLCSALALTACGVGSHSDSVETSKAVSALLGNGTTVGLVHPSGGFLSWQLRGSNSAGNADVGEFQFGQTGDQPVVGDWDGNSSSTLGVFRLEGSTGYWFLRNQNTAGNADYNPQFGQTGDRPVVGDWDGNRTTTIGVARPDSNGYWNWLLSNSNTTGTVDIPMFAYGAASLNDIPVTGDWDGDGTTTIGIVRPESSGQLHWLLRDQNSGGSPTHDFSFGTTTDIPVVGDWDGNGTTTAGYFRPSMNQWFLTNSSTAATTDATFVYGSYVSGDTPVTGAWPATNVEPLANAVTWTTGSFGGSVQTYLADVDNNGRADLIALNDDGIAVRRSYGGPPLGDSEPWSTTAFSGTTATLFGDVTNDGNADAIAVNANDVVVRPGTSSGFGPAHTWYTGSLLAGGISYAVADVDGDGKKDLVAILSGGINVGISNGTSAFDAQQWTTAGFVGNVATLVGDVTGDRRADVVAVNTGNVLVRRAQAAGVGFNQPETWSATAFSGDETTALADVTGDGLADLVAVSHSGITMRRSGRWFFAEHVETLSSTALTSYTTALFGDVTGDGRADYVEVSGLGGPVQVRARQDRQIPIRFVQLIAPGTACSSISQDAQIQAAVADANRRYREVGLSFFARPSKPTTQCPGLALSTVVPVSALSNLDDGSAPTTELATVRDALNPACDMGVSDFATASKYGQLAWLAIRCATAGEILVFVPTIPDGGSSSSDASAGKMVVLAQPVGTNMAHELGHYFGLPHNFNVGEGFGMDPLTGQDAPTSAFWDLAFVPSHSPSPALFFNGRAAAAAYEPQLIRIQAGTDIVDEDHPPVYESVNGWTCPNTTGSPCPSPALPFGSVAMPLAGDVSQLAYTFVPNTNPPQLDPRLKGTCPHPGDDQIDPSTGLPLPELNLMSYAYGGGEYAPGQGGWLSLSQVEFIQNVLTYDVLVSKLDATGHVIWGDRPRLGIAAPPATLRAVPTGGVVMPGPGTMASDGKMTWVVGTVSYSTDGNQVFSWNVHTRVWEPISAGAKQLAVAAGTAWAVTGTGSRVKRWNGSSFSVLPADSAGTCVRSLAVGNFGSTTYAWSRSCQNADGSGNYPIIRYDDTNGWVSVAGPEPAAGVNGAFDLTVDSQGVVWALAYRQGQTKAYKANLGSNGLPASWTSYATPAGTVHMTGGADYHGDHSPVDVLDSSQGVSIFNDETGGWSPAMTLPFNVREVSGSLPYLWVVNDADGTIWYVR